MTRPKILSTTAEIFSLIKLKLDQFRLNLSIGAIIATHSNLSTHHNVSEPSNDLRRLTNVLV